MSTLKIPIGEHDHIQGDPQAPCTLVEYGDYQCPDCGRAQPLVKQLQKHFSTRLRFVFRNFPLTKIHAHAQAAAEVAEFAATKEQFWKMHDLLFENQTRLGEELFEELARELKIDPDELQQALENKTFAEGVRADFAGGIRSGVNGTPTFFINGQRYDDLIDYDSMVAAIEKALAS